MNLRETLLSIVRELMARPTAPFREEPIRDYVVSFLADRHIDAQVDGMGNVIATYGPDLDVPPLAFTAHMDHPGFLVEKDSRRGSIQARFHGSVEESYFVGASVQFFTESGRVPARVVKTRFEKDRRRKHVWLESEGTVRKGDMGMWDVPALRVRGDRLTTRACDDLVGVAAILAFLDELHRRRVRARVMGVFTVAEEAGFHGAKYLCHHQILPAEARLVAIETSAETPVARMGDGVVIRVGDRQSVFSPEMTAFLTRAAERVQSRYPDFRFQRHLMDGGTCESTVYQAFGYLNGAVCIPLGNYHNRDVRRGRIAAEYVSLSDLVHMVQLFLGLVRHRRLLNEILAAPKPEYDEACWDLGERMLWEPK